MYSQSSVLIVSGLFIFMLLAMEIGYRSSRRRQARTTEAITQANAVLAAMLGLLALLLAFTFSAALQRYEDRSQTVVAEANAIGTTYLRARLLPREMHDEVQALLRQYLDVRIQEGRVDATEPELHESLLRQAKRMEEQLWSHAVRAAELDKSVVTSGLFIQSLNELIDTSATRDAAFEPAGAGNRAVADARDDRADNGHARLRIGNCRASGHARGIRTRDPHRPGRLPHHRPGPTSTRRDPGEPCEHAEPSASHRGRASERRPIRQSIGRAASATPVTFDVAAGYREIPSNHRRS